MSPLRLHFAVLENGLTLIGEHDPSALSMAAGYFVRTGARDEAAGESGVSHFLEHMVFKGTARRRGDDVNRQFDEMGAQYNAFTSEEATVFYGNVLPEFQAPLLDLLTDILAPALRPDDFELERQVILEEIARYEDQPQFTVLDQVRRVFYGTHPLGQSVLGSGDSIGALTPERMRQYHARRYRAGNVILALTGRFDWEQALAHARTATAGWLPARPPRDTAEPPARTAIEARETDRFHHVHGAWMTRGVPAQGSQRYAAELAAMALGAGRGSRLFWDVVDPALAVRCSAYHVEEDGAGFFGGAFECEPHRYDEVAGRIRQAWTRLCRAGLGADELERVKRKMNSALILHNETPFGRLVQLGMGWLYRGEIERLQTILEQVDSVGLPAVNELLRGLDGEPWAEFTLRPGAPELPRPKPGAN